MGWSVRVVDVTGSTNADLVEAARTGDRGPRVLAARSQTAGRGRLGRRWQSAPGASLAMSVLWAPAVAQAAWTWLPVVVGLGALDAVRHLGAAVGTGPGEVALKWPNDVVVVQPAAPGPRAATEAGPAGATTGLAKLAGILAEAVAGPAGPAVVLGVGVNLDDPDPDPEPRPASGPAPAATSLRRVLSDEVTLDEVLPVLAAAVQDRLERWERAGGDAVASGAAADYRAVCSTLGRRVVATTPGGTREGTAVDVDPDGSLVLDSPVAGLVRVSAGDVEHVR